MPNPRVEYMTHPDGRLAIYLLEPWTGERRAESYPAAVRRQALHEFTLAPTNDEVMKYSLARSMGDHVHNMVFDDLLCARCEAVLTRPKAPQPQVQTQELTR